MLTQRACENKSMTEKKLPKESLVARLVREGLSAHEDEAKKHILAGLVRVNGEVIDKAGTRIAPEALVVVQPKKEFVSRAAYKLESALAAFGISVTDSVCADVGACTGGFTEVMLQRGARKVFAIDVGYGDLDWKVRSDLRVVVMERTNARYVESLAELVSFVAIDVSFISLEKILPAVVKWLAPRADIVALIKPQFEAQKSEVGEGGIITDPAVHQAVVDRVIHFLPQVQLECKGLQPSPLLGTEGNKEFLLWARRIPE
jgi:23S rRNA (cytidine1920-2'-O)/16S rRNA (cytidine1409-2'-O)-methyltransferase